MDDDKLITNNYNLFKNFEDQINVLTKIVRYTFFDRAEQHQKRKKLYVYEYTVKGSKPCHVYFPFLTSVSDYRIYHRSQMQTEKSQPEGKRIMAETKFTEFLALFVGPRVGISWSASETNV